MPIKNYDTKRLTSAVSSRQQATQHDTDLDSTGFLFSHTDKAERTIISLSLEIGVGFGDATIQCDVARNKMKRL